MNVRLMCMQSAWSLGIIDGNGQVHLDKLEDHVHGCAECRQYYKKAIFDLLHKIVRQPQTSRVSPGAPAS